MATFQTAYSRLLRTINRPSSDTDVLQGAKDAINDAILYLQRNHGYAYTQVAVDVPMAANSFSVDLANDFDLSMRDVQSVFEVNTSGKREGKPLKVVTFSKLQADRMNYHRRHSSGDPLGYLNESLDGFTIEDAYRSDKLAFLYGCNLGIYPMQSNAQNYVVFGHQWIQEMTADADTNFFLDYAMDVVITIALKRMHLYLKLDSRFSVTEQEISDLIAGLVNWDAQILTGNNNNL